jgi:hypothetical protein
MWLVSVTALLRRYSPSRHPLLSLLSHVPALVLVTNHTCRAKLSTLYDFVQGSGGPNRLLGSLNWTPPQNISFSCKADSPRSIAGLWLFPRRICPRLPRKPLLFYTRYCLSAFLPTPNLLAHCNFFFILRDYFVYLFLSVIELAASASSGTARCRIHNTGDFTGYK